MPKWMLVIGVVAGLLAALLMNLYLTKMEESQVSQPYLKLQPEISLIAGDAVEQQIVETIWFPETAATLATVAIPDTPENRVWVFGRSVARDVQAGDLLQFRMFETEQETHLPSLIGEGLRAMSIPVGPSSAVGFFVEPGSRVDLVGTLSIEETEFVEVPVEFERSSTEAPQGFQIPQVKTSLVTKTILQNVRVLAVGRALSRPAYTQEAVQGYGTITIEVGPRDAEILIFALGQLQDDLKILLRNPSDKSVLEIPVVSWQDFVQETE